MKNQEDTLLKGRTRAKLELWNQSPFWFGALGCTLLSLLLDPPLELQAQKTLYMLHWMYIWILYYFSTKITFIFQASYHKFYKTI